MQGIFITGSGTEVGKTTIARLIINYLKKTHKVVKARKPVESGCKHGIEGLIPQDAKLLNDATCGDEDLNIVCPYRFSHKASTEECSITYNKELLLSQLVSASKNNINNNDFVIVEGAGGIYSPIAKNALNSDLMLELGLPIIIVIKDELGCVNHALLTIEAAKKHKLNILAIVLNTIISNNFNNLAAIKKYSTTTTLTYSSDVDNFMLQLESFL